LKKVNKHSRGESVVHPEQIQIWRRMSPGEKLQIANSLYWSAWEAKAAWLRQIHPSWSEEQIEKTIQNIFLHATT
jgi:hypothetical protein